MFPAGRVDRQVQTRAGLLAAGVLGWVLTLRWRRARYRGVSKKKGKWEAKVMVNRKWAYRELFDSEEEAARAYDDAVWRLKPKEARSYINFKERYGAEQRPRAPPRPRPPRQLSSLRSPGPPPLSRPQPRCCPLQ